MRKPGVALRRGEVSLLSPSTRPLKNSELLTARTHELVAKLNPYIDSRSLKAPGITHAYIGSLVKALPSLFDLRSGMVIVFGQLQMTTANRIANEARDMGRMVLRFDDYQELLRTNSAAKVDMVCVSSGSDAYTLKYAAPLADRCLLLVAGIEGGSCDEALRMISLRLEEYKRIDKSGALLTWAAIKRNLRLLVRAKSGPKGPHSAVFAVSRYADEDENDGTRRRHRDSA